MPSSKRLLIRCGREVLAETDMDDENDFVVVSDRKAKGKINIFDDDISVAAARSELIKSFQSNDDDDEDDEINFDGTPAVKFTSRPGTVGVSASKAPMPDLSSLAMPATSPTSRTSTFVEGSVINSAAFGSVSSAIKYSYDRPLNHSMGPSHRSTDILKQTVVLGSSSSLLDIEESIGGGVIKHVSSTEINKLQQEINSLQRSLLSARADRWIKLSTEDNLRRIIKGEDFSLEMYKSLEDKLDFLDKATQWHDGNAITTAVLFLQRTVNRAIFVRELQARPIAANHYLNYLKAHFDYTDYIDTLLFLGRREEAAIFKYKLAVQTSDVNVKISKLEDCLRSSFKANPSLAPDALLVQDYVDLLERQRPIDETDANSEASGKSALFRDFPRKRSLVDMPVVTTLYYCCLYHYDLAENSLASPDAIRKRHQISDKQFTWTVISARAKLRYWKDIEAVLTTKAWFGGTKMKAVIGFPKIVEILHKNSAPPDVLEKYLALIEDLELRLTLARKVACLKSVIDTLVAMKNRPELEVFTAKLDRFSKEGLYAHDILNSSAIKWK